MSLSVFDVLTPDRIELDLKAVSQNEAIITTILLLKSSPHVLDINAFTREVQEREKSSPTSVGNGLAFPHARTDSVDQLVAAAGRSREGIVFGPNAERVHLVFVIGTPKEMVREYLGLVGDLARRVKQAAVREELLRSGTATEFLAALRAASKG